MIVDFIGQHYHTVSNKVQYCRVTFTFPIMSNSMLFDYIRILTFVIVISSLKHSIFSCKTLCKWTAKQGISIYQIRFKLSMKRQSETEQSMLLWKSWSRANYSFIFEIAMQFRLKDVYRCSCCQKKKRYFLLICQINKVDMHMCYSNRTETRHNNEKQETYQ